MRKTEGAAKINGPLGYCKHLGPYGKRAANKASRRFSKKDISRQLEAEELDSLRESEEEKEKREAMEFEMELASFWEKEHQDDLRYYGH